MGPPPDTPIPATTPEILLHYTYVDKIVQGLLFSAFALLVWDHALTFHREVEYVWKGRWTVIKILFLFTRYATLVVVGGNAWILTGTVRGLTNTFCNHWLLICSAIELLCISFVSFVILFRLHAVWGVSRKTFIALLFAWFLSFVGATIIFFTIFYGSRRFIYHEDHFNICFAVVPHIWLQWLPDALLHALMLVIILWKAIATPRSSQTPMLGLLYRDGIMYYSTTLVILVAGILIWRFADLAWIGGPLYVGWVLCQIAMSRLLLSLRSVSAFSARMTAAAKSRPHIRLRMYDSGNSNSNSNNNSNGRLQADPTRHYSMTPASSVENHRYPLETFYRSGTVMSTRSTTTNASNEDGATLVHHDSYAVYRDGKESPDGGGGKDRERHEYGHGHGHGHGENGDMARNENRLLSPLGSSPRYERQGRTFVREVHSHSEPEPVYLSPGGGGRGGGRGRRREGVDDSYSDHHPTVRRIASRAELEEDLTRARTRVGNYGTPVPPRQRLRNLWWWLIGRELDGTNGNGNENEETDVDGMMMVGVEEDANALGGIYRCPTTNPPRRTRRGLVVVRDARVCVDAAEVERWDPEDDRGPGVKDSRLGRYDHWL